MKKFRLTVVLLLTVFCLNPSSFAQIRVFGPAGGEEIPIGLPEPGDVVPVPEPGNSNGGGDGVIVNPDGTVVDPGKPIDSDGGVIDPTDPNGKPWDPDQYINELRAKTLDQYGDQVAQNIHLGLLACGGELVSAATDYTVPSVEEIKATYFTVVQSFGVSGVTPETLLGAFADQFAQALLNKLPALSRIERQMLGIYLPESNEEALKMLSQQVIWSLEGLTGQEYYNELFTLLYQYVKWPDYKDPIDGREPYPPDGTNPDGSKPDPTNPEEGTNTDNTGSNVSVENSRVNVNKNSR